jgi:hypothetical protein
MCQMRSWLVVIIIPFIVLTIPGMAQDTSSKNIDIDPTRSLFITDRDILDGRFALFDVLQTLVEQSQDPHLTPLRLWQQWWDTERQSPGLGLGPNCDHQLTPAGKPALNGFPITCPRLEGSEAEGNPFGSTGDALYVPVALVNRFDLAPLDGTNCGEYRIVYARRSASPFERNFLIFEAVLPNPTPQRGLVACRPVARFWAQLSTIDAPEERARLLNQLYFQGSRAFHQSCRSSIMARTGGKFAPTSS